MELNKISRLLFILFIILFIYWLFDTTIQYVAAAGVFMLGATYGHFSNRIKKKVAKK